MNTNKETCNRFGLTNGQFYGEYLYKNLQWELNGVFFGYGDITVDQALNIALTLKDGETFKGWNEHHNTSMQQTDLPMVIITNKDIELRSEIVNKNV